MEQLSNKEQILLQKVREFLANGEKITIRLLQESLGYASPRSISVLLGSLIEKWLLYRDARDMIQSTPNFSTDSYQVKWIPLIWSIACGMPIFAEENIETEIPVSTKLLYPSEKYFFLRAQGDSMNQKGIQDGDLVLIRQSVIPEPWKIVVALINDEATLKEFRREWEHVFLLPHSDNPRHKPIILDDSDGNILIQWIFIRSFPGNLFS